MANATNAGSSLVLQINGTAALNQTFSRGPIRPVIASHELIRAEPEEQESPQSKTCLQVQLPHAQLLNTTNEAAEESKGMNDDFATKAMPEPAPLEDN